MCVRYVDNQQVSDLVLGGYEPLVANREGIAKIIFKVLTRFASSIGNLCTEIMTEPSSKIIGHSIVCQAISWQRKLVQYFHCGLNVSSRMNQNVKATSLMVWEVL